MRLYLGCTRCFGFDDAVLSHPARYHRRRYCVRLTAAGIIEPSVNLGFQFSLLLVVVVAITVSITIAVAVTILVAVTAASAVGTVEHNGNSFEALLVIDVL